ncbi:MAG: cellulase family glycosylhydrolase, partial [Mycobacterium sp.]
MITVVAIALMSIAATNVFSGPPRVASYDVAQVAAITPTNTTVGIADSDIFFMNTANINKTLDAMQSLGVKNVRIVIPWYWVEPKQGQYDWSQVDAVVKAATARNMGILADINGAPAWAAVPGGTAPSAAPKDPKQFAAFAALAATRYKGKISAYEIWNEPNGQYFYNPTPNAAGYVALLKAAYPAIKLADPSATVVGGVIAAVNKDYGDFATGAVNYVSQMYAAGAKGYFDALSFHPYATGLAFSTGGILPDSPKSQLEAIRQLMVYYGDGGKKIWASEYGDPTVTDTEAVQAGLISDFLNTWSTLSYAGPAFIYTTRDSQTGSSDPEDNFGLFRTDWTPKAAATVVKNFISGTRTNPYGSAFVQSVASGYMFYKVNYGQGVADNALLTIYNQSLSMYGLTPTTVYFTAIRFVIAAAIATQAAPATTVAAKTVTTNVTTTTAVTAQVDPTVKTAGTVTAVVSPTGSSTVTTGTSTAVTQPVSTPTPTSTPVAVTPSPTSVAVTPSPTSVAVTPSPTTVAVTPSPTSVAVTPSPTSVAVTPTRTPVAVTPSPTPVAVTPTRTPVAVTPTPTPVAVTPTRTPVAVTPSVVAKPTKDVTPSPANQPPAASTPEKQNASDKQKKGPRWGHGRIVNRGPAASVVSPAQKEPPVST